MCPQPAWHHDLQLPRKLYITLCWLTLPNAVVMKSLRKAKMGDKNSKTKPAATDMEQFGGRCSTGAVPSAKCLDIAFPFLVCIEQWHIPLLCKGKLSWKIIWVLISRDFNPRGHGFGHFRRRLFNIIVFPFLVSHFKSIAQLFSCWNWTVPHNMRYFTSPIYLYIW